MKLRTFNTTNILVTRRQDPYLHINIKTGLFTINKTAAEKMTLKNKDLVAFHQDENEKENWYLEKVAKDGFEIRAASKTGGGIFFFNSVTLSRHITESVDEDRGGRIVIGEQITYEKRKLWTLITQALKKTNLRKVS